MFRYLSTVLMLLVALGLGCSLVQPYLSIAFEQTINSEKEFEKEEKEDKDNEEKEDKDEKEPKIENLFFRKLVAFENTNWIKYQINTYLFLIYGKSHIKDVPFPPPDSIILT